MNGRNGRKSFDTETLMAIGGRIREARGSLTQEDFSQKIGVSRATLTNYESGRRLPNDLTLKRIADESGHGVAYLLFGKSSVDFDNYRMRIEEEAVRRYAERPGFIPKFQISDDEMAFVSLFRLFKYDNSQADIIKAVIEHAREFVIQDREDGEVPVPWGIGFIEQLEAALKRGELEEGYDPSFMLWTTFWEAKHARS